MPLRDVFRKKRTPQPPSETAGGDPWTIATHEREDGVTIFRFRSTIPPAADPSRYFNLIEITWAYDACGPSGLPSNAVTKRMEEFENLLDHALEPSGRAFLMVVVTGNSSREWQWYARDVADTMEAVNLALTGRPVFPVEFELFQDPTWEAYSQFQGAVMGGAT